jgi:hypothetical protein
MHACLIALAFHGHWLSAAAYPQVQLSNDTLSLTIYLPDAEKGYYRGTRFDWSGVLGHVRFADHTIFGPWKDRHDPTNYDDIVGPVEEFGTETPWGYDEAQVGETFVKIGVGALIKPQEDRYRFSQRYRFAKSPSWLVNTSADAVTFQQQLSTLLGYGYDYTKVIRLDPSGFQIIHELKNTGSKLLTTDHYNHNFFNVDNDPIGPHYQIMFPGQPKARGETGRFQELVQITEDRVLTLTKPLDQGFVFAHLDGQSGLQGPLRFLHQPTGVEMTAETDVPLDRLRFWAAPRTICPEPFVVFTLKPGESKSWTTRYTFAIRK